MLLEGGVGVVGQQRRDQAGVVGRRLEVAGVDVELVAGRRQLGDQRPELVGVDQVAVVAERDRAVGGRPEGRLRVLPDARAGRGVAAVADREVALERGERGLVEDLGDQPHVLVDEDLATVADRDPGRLLAAVLERVEAEVGELGDVLARRPDPEHAAVVLGAEVLGVECCAEAAVAGTGPAGSEHAASLQTWQGDPGWGDVSRVAGHRGCLRTTMLGGGDSATQGAT